MLEKQEIESRLEKLRDEHFGLELKIEEIRRRPLLTSEDHFKIKNLKKMKLKTKDKIEELTAQLSV